MQNHSYTAYQYSLIGKVVKKQSTEDLIFTLLVMLLGKEGEDWFYYEADTDWWNDRLYKSRN